MSYSTDSGLLTKLGRLWCKFAHDDLMWPIQGQYQCRRCMHSHPIPWAQDAAGDKIAREFATQITEQEAVS